MEGWREVSKRPLKYILKLPPKGKGTAWLTGTFCLGGRGMTVRGQGSSCLRYRGEAAYLSANPSISVPLKMRDEKHINMCLLGCQASWQSSVFGRQQSRQPSNSNAPRLNRSPAFYNWGHCFRDGGRGSLTLWNEIKDCL